VEEDAGEVNSRPEESIEVSLTALDTVRAPEPCLEEGQEDVMCRRVACTRCGKPTWAGCGRHIEEALRGVPVDQRCSCPRPKSLLARLFGRRP
jgi:hypothetical protein